MQKIDVGMYDAQEQPFIGAMISANAAGLMVSVQHHLLQLGAKSILELKHMDVETGFVSPGIIDVTEILAPVASRSAAA